MVHELDAARGARDLGTIVAVTPHGRGMNSVTWLIVAERGRCAVQADYFARRIWHRDVTGINDPVENARGLADARHRLVGA